MKLVQFFHILGDQVARFAPYVVIAEEWAKLLTELRSISHAADVDDKLMHVIDEKLSPIWKKAIADAHAGAAAAVADRIAELEQERAAIEAKRLEAQQNEVEREKQARAAREVAMREELLEQLRKELASASQTSEPVSNVAT